MGRAGMDGEVTHHALQDVYDTIITLEKGLKKLWGYSSDGQSACLARKRSWVRLPLPPQHKKQTWERQI